MSFANLHSARKSKEARSFAKSTVVVDHHKETITENAVPSQPSAPAEIEMAKPEVAPPVPPLQFSDQPEAVSDLPIALPASINVRKSENRGRGLYAKQGFAPGIVLTLCLVVESGLTFPCRSGTIVRTPASLCAFYSSARLLLLILRGTGS